MLNRFEGNDGRRRLREALLSQKCLANDATIVAEIAKSCALKSYKKDKLLIKHNGSDNDLVFILSGRVAVRVHGQELAIRNAGEHIGEMALIDPGLRRSADVVAIENVTVARVAEKDVAKIAMKKPSLWRQLAIELAGRLNEQSRFIRAPNARPVIFIGSSSEGLEVAKLVKQGLAHSFVVPTVWTDNVFLPGHGTMEDLKKRISESDFGVLVCTGDDRVINKPRDINHLAPRDNVVLELGMCLGELGMHRTLAVQPRIKNLKMPSDLLGITPIQYTVDDPRNLRSHIGPVCMAIRDVVERMGVRL
jgi:CRP/FNR family transcriptional regulator, cyclic AMP receptor protein